MTNKPGVFSAITAALLALLIMVPAGTVHAVQYFSLPPNSEVCTTVVFGHAGRGEYTLNVVDPGVAQESPWVDNHYTSFIAGPENVVIVPLCFSTYGKRNMEQVKITMTVATPAGVENYDYGVCVSDFRDVDSTGAANDICRAMSESTDLFSAGFALPEQTARPGETAEFTLYLDSSMPLSVQIGKGTGSLPLIAGTTDVQLGSGMQEVKVRATAPSSAGDYPFSVTATVTGCSISDCRKEVNGILHVSSEAPSSSFDAWLAPSTKNIIGVQNTPFVFTVQNYGPRQQFTFAVKLASGLESDFIPYSAMMEQGEMKSVTFRVRPLNDDRTTYKVEAVATAGDGAKKTSTAWLSVDEMVADARRSAEQNPSAAPAVDSFVSDYDKNKGASLQDWQELKSVTGAATGTGGDTGQTPGTETPPEGMSLITWIIIGVAAAVVVFLIVYIYRKSSVQDQGEGFASLR